ncbi:hypothetical protein TWF281_009047 [Arthrobotrys megalospora]
MRKFKTDMQDVFTFLPTSEFGARRFDIASDTKAAIDIRNRAVGAVREMMQGLYSNLRDHLPGCQITHKARLHLPIPEKSEQVIPESGPSVNMYLSTCTDPVYWQGATCTIKNHSIVPCASQKEIDNLCGIIKQSQARRQALRLLYGGGDLYHTLASRRRPAAHEGAEDSSELPSISLRSLLENGYFRQNASLKKKRILAVILAHLMLKLCGGPWIRDRWEAENIHFPYYHSSNKMIVNFQQPYLDGSLSSEWAETDPNTDDPNNRHNHPLILDFACLLLEIQCGETMKPTQPDFDKNTLQETPNTRYFMIDRILRDISENMYQDYKSAIEACLDCGEYLPTVDTSFDDANFRCLIYQRIVAPLEEELFKGYGIDLKKLDSLQHDFRKDYQFQPSFPTQVSSLSQTFNVLSIDSVPVTSVAPAETQELAGVSGAASFKHTEMTSSRTEYPIINGRMGAPTQTRVDCFSLSTAIHTSDSFQIAIICPMGLELAPVLAMLDREYQSIPFPINMNTSKYILGQMAGLNVVVTVMPEIGNNSAAAVVTRLTNDFKSLRFGLLVGVGGGIPDPDGRDIRLGDIVVSKPTEAFSGAVQFDRGKANSGNCFKRTGSLNKPSKFLLSTLEELIGRHKMGSSKVATHLSELIRKRPSMGREYVYQGEENDVLYRYDYHHSLEEGDCKKAGCTPDMIVNRAPRESTAPRIHYGTISSSNLVVKDGETRERLKKDLNIICVEMEAAGLMDDLPCLVIRGICDYADSHKSKGWQPYAAATAAAFAKEFLSIVPAGFST